MGRGGLALAQGNMSPVCGAYMRNDFVRGLRRSANSTARSSSGREQAPEASAPTSLTLARGSRRSQFSRGGQQVKVGSPMSGLFVIHHLAPMPSHNNRQIHARRFRERVMAEGLSTEAQDVYLGHVPALLGMGLDCFTRLRDETYPHFGIDPPFGLESQKTSGGFRVTRGCGSPAADYLAPVFPACLGTNEKRRRVAPKLACLQRQLFSFCSCPCP